MAKAKKKIKVRDMKPKKDAKGGGVSKLSSNRLSSGLSSNLSSSSASQLSSASSSSRN